MKPTQKKPRTLFYTVVHEGYDVEIYRTLRGVTAALGNSELCLEDANYAEEEPVEATANDIARALRKYSSVRLYPLNGGDWKYRIDKQDYIHK